MKQVALFREIIQASKVAFTMKDLAHKINWRVRLSQIFSVCSHYQTSIHYRLSVIWRLL